MSLFSVPLRNVVRVYLMLVLVKRIQSIPINNGFSVKFNPISVKEEVKTKSFGAIFAKIPQELKPQAAEEILSKAIFPQATPLGMGSSNQIAKILFPLKTSHAINESKTLDNTNFINIPIFRQPVNDYKIIVATAPKNIRIGRGEEPKPVFVYIVFPDDDHVDPKSLNMPSIYFVNTPDTNIPFDKHEKVDPIFIIDNNRTVTGINSNTVAKFVKFKNKLTKHFDFHLAP